MKIVLPTQIELSILDLKKTLLALARKLVLKMIKLGQRSRLQPNAKRGGL